MKRCTRVSMDDPAVRGGGRPARKRPEEEGRSRPDNLELEGWRVFVGVVGSTRGPPPSRNRPAFSLVNLPLHHSMCSGWGMGTHSPPGLRWWCDPSPDNYIIKFPCQRSPQGWAWSSEWTNEMQFSIVQWNCWERKILSFWEGSNASETWIQAAILVPDAKCQSTRGEIWYVRWRKEDKILRLSLEPLDQATPEAITLDAFVIKESFPLKWWWTSMNQDGC